MKRQPEGIPAGGQFAEERKSEPSGSLTHYAPASRYAEMELSLEMGESDDFWELADGDVVSNITVTRTEEGFVVEASKPINLHDLAPSELNFVEKNDWLDHNRQAVDAFFEERYSAEIGYGQDDGWEDSTVRSARTIPDDGNVTGQRLADTAWDSLVKIHNELDNGTFGSENMDRLLQEKCTSPIVIPEPAADTSLIRSDADGTWYAKAGDIQKKPRDGWKRQYNRFSGEYTITTPDQDTWTYKAAAQEQNGL